MSVRKNIDKAISYYNYVRSRWEAGTSIERPSLAQRWAMWRSGVRVARNAWNFEDPRSDTMAPPVASIPFILVVKPWANVKETVRMMARAGLVRVTCGVSLDHTMIYTNDAVIAYGPAAPLGLAA